MRHPHDYGTPFFFPLLTTRFPLLTMIFPLILLFHYPMTSWKAHKNPMISHHSPFHNYYIYIYISHSFTILWKPHLSGASPLASPPQVAVGSPGCWGAQRLAPGDLAEMGEVPSEVLDGECWWYIVLLLLLFFIFLFYCYFYYYYYFY